MKHPLSLVVASLSLALLSACSSAPSSSFVAPTVVKDGALVSTGGEVLYTYKKDANADKSACVRDCLKVFGPLYPGPDDVAGGDYKIIEREDGSTQWSYKGKPLYVCTGAKAPAGAPASMVKMADKAAENCKKAGADFELAKP
ncbi:MULTISPECIES: COG4315 family predicted lipoprotein [Uliginosibacterium]|uniref:Lipoprotein n=1 Tax=Uliginosibacterium aquaticum TaxID=2731212 RepID=A0ABX2IH32_9RHOO|nr:MULTISPECIES: hypothetical protein [Uliginosibacterium]MDO6384670.1 hypothetical protein [Uliginosibacterium sp. 31-12]NSL55597.1 hypothetical protein [Uliginosibacterium aquaticum]